MAFGVTDAGFKAKKFDDLKTEVAASLKTELNIDINSLPDSVAEVITNIYLLPLSQVESNTQALQAMFDIDKATGIWLDNLVALRGLSRSTGTYPYGDVYVISSAPVNILSGGKWSDASGNTFTNQETIVITPSLATEVSYEMETPTAQGTVYVIVIDGFVFNITGQASIPLQDTLEELKYIVEVDRPDLIVTWKTDTASEKTTLTISSVEFSNQFSVEETSSSLILATVKGYGQITADVLDTKIYSENTVTTYPPYGNIISATNLEPIQGGSGVESDDELRLRYKLTQRSGKATVEAIKSALLSVSGVTTAVVLENDTLEYDNEFDIEPKAFKAIVKGGNTQTIAEAIWDVKPAGIKSDGDVKALVVDTQGNTQTVSFSRVTNKYIHVEVTYSKYSEEDFPLDGETVMKEAIYEYGESLDVGNDVIQQRIASQVFQNISGLQEVNVALGVTDSPNDPVARLEFYPPIGISALEEAVFSIGRITISEG